MNSLAWFPARFIRTKSSDAFSVPSTCLPGFRKLLQVEASKTGFPSPTDWHFATRDFCSFAKCTPREASMMRAARILWENLWENEPSEDRHLAS
jgi:hypothetical protein